MPDPIPTPDPAPAPSTTRIVDTTTGQAYEIPADRLAEALAQTSQTGQALFRADTEADAAARERRATYGTATGEIGAGLAGAARGLTFGVSDLAGAGLGYGEDLAALREVNPGASLTGEVAGALLPVLASGGTGLAARGAGTAAREGGLLTQALRGITLPGRAVEGLSGLAERSVVGALEGSSATSRILAQGAGMAASGAIEGAAQGVQQTLTDAALGADPDITAQRLLANVGESALIGGLFGGGMGLGMGGVSLASQGARDVVGRAFREATGLDLRRGVGELWGHSADAISRASSMATGADQRVIREALGPDGAELRQLIARGDDIYDESSRAITQALTDGQRGYTHAADMWSRGLKRGQVRSRISTEALASQAEVAARHIDEIRSMAQRVVDDAASGATFEAGGVAAAARDLVKRANAADQLARSAMSAGHAADAATDLFMSLDQLKRSVGEVQGRVERVSRGSTFLAELRGTPESGYEALRRTLEDESLWGGAANMQRDVNASYTRALDRRRQFEQDFLRAGGEKDELDPFRRIAEADSARVDSFVRGAGTARNDSRAVTFREALDSQLEMLETMRAHTDLDPTRAASVDEAIQQTRRAREVFDLHEERVGRVNQFRALEQGTGVERALTAQAVGMVAGGPLGAAIATALASPAVLARGLGAIERAAQRVTWRIDSGVSSYVRRALERARSGARTARRIAVDSALVAGVRVSEAAFRGEVSRILEAHANPERTRAQVAESTDAVGRVAPSVQQALQQRALATTAFLASKVPQSARPADSLLPGMQWSRDTSTPERARFMRYVRAANDPLLALDELESGSISPESVEVLRTLYPAVHAQIVARFADELARRARNGAQVPYSARLSIGALLGAPTDESLRPSSLAAYQQAAAVSAAEAEAQEQASGMAPRRSGDLSALGRDTGAGDMLGTGRREAARG